MFVLKFSLLFVWVLEQKAIFYAALANRILEPRRTVFFVRYEPNLKYN